MNQRCVPSLVLLMTVLLLNGCGTGRTDGLDRALDAYRLGDDHAALRALEDHPPTDGDRRIQALYIKGMAHHRRGERSLALAAFEQAAAGSQGDIGHRAAAMAGVTSMELGQVHRARRHLSRASQSLTGHDQREAARLLASLDGHATSPHSHVGGFVLQFGAYQDRSRAEDAAGALARDPSVAHLGPIHVRAGGEGFYLVQVGGFQTRNEASSARAAIGQSRCIVAAAP